MPILAEQEIFAGANGRGVSFDEIVRARATVSRSDRATPPFASPAAEDEWNARERERLEHEEANADALWEEFQRREGRVDASYFSSSGVIGVALTVPPDTVWFSFRRRGRPRLHVTLDLATAGAAAPLVSRYMHVCVKADQRLLGEERQHVIRVVYDRLCALMKIVEFSLEGVRVSYSTERLGPDATDAERKQFDARQAQAKAEREVTIKKVEQERAQRVENALKVAEGDATQTEEVCDRAVQRVALMSYFVGMLIGVAFFTLLGCAIGLILGRWVNIHGFDLTIFLTTFVAGAVGAVVSVMSRMSSGNVVLDYETGRSYIRVVGAFRPLIGAIFGVALYFGLASGLIPAKLPLPSSREFFFFYAFIAFLAGFSERWAQDMLVVGRRGIGRASPTDGSTSPE
jgi:hypothetical protein